MTSTSPSLDDLEGYFAEESFVRSLAKSLLFDEGQVDDVVQQTWVEAIRRSRSSEEPASLRAWLASVVRSRAHNERRAAERRTHREREAAVAEELPSAAELIERADVRHQVVEAVAALPDAQRIVVLLRYFENEPPRKIARRLALPVDTVKTRLKRGLSTLRQRLDAANAGDRRGWQLGLLPVALPLRTSIGSVLATKSSAVLGVLMSLKHVLIMVFGGMAAAWFFSSELFHDPGRPELVVRGGSTQAASSGAGPAHTATAVAPGAVSDARRVRVPSGRSEAAVAPSVAAARAGFRGRVVMPDGAPAIDQLVRVIALDPVRAFASVAVPFGESPKVGPSSHSARTDTEGRFDVSGVPAGELYALHAGVDGPHPRYQFLHETPGPGRVVDLGTIQLAAKGAIAGRVVDEDGEPIAGAEVWAADVPGAILALAPVDRLVRDGALFLSLPATPSFELGTDQGAANYHGVLWDHVGKNVMVAAEGGSWVALDLPPWLERTYDELPISRAKTDASGQFEIVGVSNGGNVLVVAAPGFASGGNARVLVQPGKRRDVGTIRLRNGGGVDLRVVDPDGRPVSGAELRWALQPAAGLTGLLFAGPVERTGASGRVAIRGVPRRAGVVVAYRADAGAPWSFDGPFDDGDVEDLKLPASRTIEVSLRSEDAETKIDGIEWQLLSGPPLGEINAAGLNQAIDLGERLVASSETPAAQRTYEIRDLSDGLYTLSLRVEGLLDHHRILRVDDTIDGPVEIALRRATGFDLAVVDARGHPVHGAEVYVQTETLPAWARTVLYQYGGVRGWRRLVELCGTTDVSGRLSIVGLPVEPVTIVVRHPAFGAATERTALPRSTMSVVLGDAASVEGRLFDHGKPASPDEWQVVAVPVTDQALTSMPDVDVSARLDADGRYRLEGLTPREYSIEARAVPEAIETLGQLLDSAKPTWSFGIGERPIHKKVTLKAGERRELSFDLDLHGVPPGVAGIRISGRVTIDGRPATGFEIQNRLRPDDDWSPVETIATTDASGHFVRDPMRRDGLQLSVLDPATKAVVWRRDVEAGDEPSVDLQIAIRTGAARIVVVDSAGQPASGHEVEFFGTGVDGARSFRSGMTGAEGVFAERLPAGTYSVRCRGLAGQALHGPVRVVAGEQVVARVGLESKGWISGRVIQATGQDMKYVRLGSTTVSVWRSVLIRDDGSFYTQASPGEYELTLYDAELSLYEAKPSRVVVDSELGAPGQIIRAGPPIDR